MKLKNKNKNLLDGINSILETVLEKSETNDCKIEIIQNEEKCEKKTLWKWMNRNLWTYGKIASITTDM